MKKRKTIKNYIYEGLGFPIELKEIQAEEIMGEWTPVIDVELVAKEVIKMLAKPNVRLTGNHIKFIRHYFSMSLRDFARKVVSKSHMAVAKWEKYEDEPTNMDINIEKMLKLYIYDQVSDARGFHHHYIDLCQYDVNSKDSDHKIKIQALA